MALPKGIQWTKQNKRLKNNNRETMPPENKRRAAGKNLGSVFMGNAGMRAGTQPCLLLPDILET